MRSILLICSLLAAVFCDTEKNETLHRGVQVRLTDKGLAYAVQTGFKVMERELEGKPFPSLEGSAGIVDFSVHNATLLDVSVGSSDLRTIADQGIEVSITKMNLKVRAKLRYKLKGFIPIGDTTDLTAIVGGTTLKAVFEIGATSDGKPSISTLSCDSSIGSMSLKFSGGATWVYNTLSSLLSGVLKNFIASTICKEAKNQIATVTDQEMKTFPSAIPIDEYASIDYRLTSPPLFTESYMDAFIKGKFVSVNATSPTHLRIPTFPTSSDSSKMVYMWLTDYTLNTAGEVYHKSGALNIYLEKDDVEMPFFIRYFMSTSWLRFFMPTLYSKYPGMPLRFALSSRTAPTIDVVPGAAMVRIYAKAAVQVDLGSNKSVDVFYLNMDINATATFAVKNEHLTGSITSAKLRVTLGATNVGTIRIPMQSSIMKLVMRYGVLKPINYMLTKGFPLPTIEGFSFDNSTVLFQQDVIRVGTDIVYAPKANQTLIPMPA